jgi:hypothetical protein
MRHKDAGIKIMLEARLKRRMRDLGVESFGEYW